MRRIEGKDVIIGSCEFDIDTFIKTIRYTVPENFYYMKERWPNFARRLHTPPQTMDSIRDRLYQNAIELEDIIFEILTVWKNKDNDGATLNNLIEALEAEGMFSYAGAIKSKLSQLSADQASVSEGMLVIQHLQTNLLELLSTTNLTPLVLLTLFANDVLSANEVEHLLAIRSTCLRNNEFYGIIQKRPQTFKYLLTIFAHQPRVMEVLVQLKSRKF